jgi:hypothetical protein
MLPPPMSYQPVGTARPKPVTRATSGDGRIHSTPPHHSVSAFGSGRLQRGITGIFPPMRVTLEMGEPRIVCSCGASGVRTIDSSSSWSLKYDGTALVIVAERMPIGTLLSVELAV